MSACPAVSKTKIRETLPTFHRCTSITIYLKNNCSMNSKPPEGHDTESDDLIETEIQDLEQRLEQARLRLRNRKAAPLNGASHELHNGGGTHQQAVCTLNGEPRP